MADYRKAKALLADQGAPASSPAAAAGAGQQQGLQQPDGGMWAKLMDEIDKVGMHRPPPSGTQLVRNCLCQVTCTMLLISWSWSCSSIAWRPVWSAGGQLGGTQLGRRGAQRAKQPGRSA